jgi:hypothetical protein
MTAAVLNVLSLAFEDSLDKQRLAMLTLIIKAVACHSHLDMLAERPILFYDVQGAV